MPGLYPERLRPRNRRLRKRSRSRGISPAAARPRRSARRPAPHDRRGHAAERARSRARRPRRSGRRRAARCPAARGPRRRVSPVCTRTGARPAQPTATPVVPRRNGRPKESVTITPTSASRRTRRAAARAEASGSTGSSIATSPAARVRAVDAGRGADEAVVRLADQEGAAPAHDARALAEDQLDHRADRPRRRRSPARAPDGSTVASATLRPSTFETAFCATHTTSPSRRPPAQRSAAASSSAGEIVARAQLGQAAQPGDA